MYADSFDKIKMYMRSLVKGVAQVGGEVWIEKNIFLSPLIVREIKCVRGCGGCCPTFTLDYLPNEAPEGTLDRQVLGKIIRTFPFDKNRKGCLYLSKENGDCLIHTNRPFTCDFEMIRFKQFEKINKVLIGTFPFGRGWAFTKYNGCKGCDCLKCGYSVEYKNDVLRKLNRLKDWIDYFEVPTYINELMNAVANLNSCVGPIININSKKQLF